MKVLPLVGLATKKRRGVQGKIARRKQKDSKFADSLKANALRTITDSSDTKPSPLVKPYKDAPKNLSQLNINDLKNNLTTNCVPVTRDAIPKRFPKKDKRKLRRETFLKKLGVVNELRDVNKKRKRAKKTASVILEEDSSTLLTDTDSKSSEVQPLDKRKKVQNSKLKQPILKKKDRLNQELQDIRRFKEVLSNSVYKANPGATITNYVRQKVCESLIES